MWWYNHSHKAELMHYGVLGMKWGQHKAKKYENKSAISKESADEWDAIVAYQSNKKGTFKRASEYKRRAEEDRKKAKDYSNRAKQIKAEINIKKDRAEASKNRRSISDSDLDYRINRLKKERQLKELTNADLNPGRTAVKSFIKSTGSKVVTSAAAGATAYLGYSYMERQGWGKAASYMFPNPNKKK